MGSHMNRLTDIQELALVDPAPSDLPPVDWASIGKAAPQIVPVPNWHPSDSLPAADIVVKGLRHASWN
jgi:hypothetical protein